MFLFTVETNGEDPTILINGEQTSSFRYDTPQYITYQVTNAYQIVKSGTVWSSGNTTVFVSFSEDEQQSQGGGGGGTTNYNALTNKPSINSVVLTGNKTAADLNLLTESSLTAENVSYTNGSIQNVGQALDSILYVAPSITSFTGGGTYEVGQTITSVNLAWSVNKNVTTQSLNNGIGSIDPSLRNYTVSDVTLTTNTTYTLTVGDGQQTATRSTAINFRYKRYWGVNASPDLTNEQILQLSSEFATNRQQSRTFNCSGGQYFFFVIPTSFCSGISFKVGGLAFSDINVQTIEFTNASGNTSSYNIYRPNNIQTGSAISVEVL